MVNSTSFAHNVRDSPCLRPTIFYPEIVPKLRFLPKGFNVYSTQTGTRPEPLGEVVGMLWDAADRQEADSFSAYAFIAAKYPASRQLTSVHLKALNGRGIESKFNRRLSELASNRFR